MERLKTCKEYMSDNGYMEKVSMAVVNGILQAIALNLFWRPGHIYASGITGLGQIIVTLAEKVSGIELPMGVVLYCLNIPLFILAWIMLSRKFTIFTMISVFMTAFLYRLFLLQCYRPILLFVPFLVEEYVVWE